MTEKRFTYHEEWVNSEGDLFHHVIEKDGKYFAWFHTWYKANLVCDELNKLADENEQLKQTNERIVKDIDLALGFIEHKGYSLQDIKDYEDAKKEYEEDLAYYRKGDVE